MSTCLLAYPDKTPGAVLSGGSWEPLLPLDNLKTAPLIEKARTTDAASASTTWDTDLGAPTHIRLLALVDHNASPSATVRVRCSLSASFASTVYDSGVVSVYAPMHPAGGLPSGHPDASGGGTITQAELADFPQDLYFVLTTGYSIQARYVRVEIFDADNQSGYFQLARCFIAPAWQPGSNMNYGAAFDYESATIADSIPGGVTYYDIRTARRTVTFTLKLATAETLSQSVEMKRRLDIHGELFFVFDPDHATLVERQQSFLATIRELSPLEYAYVSTNVSAYKLAEVL